MEHIVDKQIKTDIPFLQRFTVLHVACRADDPVHLKVIQGVHLIRCNHLGVLASHLWLGKQLSGDGAAGTGKPGR